MLVLVDTQQMQLKIHLGFSIAKLLPWGIYTYAFYSADAPTPA